MVKKLKIKIDLLIAIIFYIILLVNQFLIMSSGEYRHNRGLYHIRNIMSISAIQDNGGENH